MTTNETLRQISQSLGRLEGTMEEGLKNICERLDKINGRIDRNCDEIDKLQSDNDKMKGKIAGVGFIGGLIGAAVGLWASLFK